MKVKGQWLEIEGVICSGDFLKDLRDICFQLSNDIKVMVRIVMMTKKTKHYDLRTNSHGK